VRSPMDPCLLLERTRPVPAPGLTVAMAGHPRSPRNVAIRRADGTVVVRPYRGLRTP